MVKIFKKLIVLLCILLVLMNFTLNIASFAEEMSADEMAEAMENDYTDPTGEGETEDDETSSWLSNAASGIAGLLLTAPKITVLALATILQTVGLGVANLAGKTADAETGLTLSLDDILFNKINLTSIDFFNTTGGTGIIYEIREQIALWYYVMRVIAIAILLVILIFVGIRMAITTVASEKAIYKKALFDWLTSLALVFLLHYIIRGVIWINDSLVAILANVGDLANMGELLGALRKLALKVDFCIGFGATIVYCFLTVQSFMFLISYIKRMLVLAFLIIISPLITITYSIDKMGDQKAQALNTWLKEFSYNVLIQPFHCILYIVFANMAIEVASTRGSLGALILSILCIKFVWDGEKIVRKIFGFEQASSLVSAAASGAIIGSALSKATSVGKTAASGIKYASKSKTGQVLKQKFNDKKAERKDLKGLDRSEKKQFKDAKKAKDQTRMDAFKQTASDRRKDKEDAKKEKRNNSKIHQMAQKAKESKAGEIAGSVKKTVSGFAKSDLGKAIGADTKKFVRKLTQPENIAKVSAGIFTAAAMYALPDSNIVSAVGGGYAAGRAAENKVREIKNRKSENYEEDVIKGWENYCNATGTNKNDKDAFKNWMDLNVAEGKGDTYSQSNMQDSENKARENLRDSNLNLDTNDINAIIASIKRAIATGDGYKPDEIFANYVDNKDIPEVNKLVGQFAAFYNNSMMYSKTDAFDSQMEQFGYDHEEVVNDIDVSKLQNNNNTDNTNENINYGTNESAAQKSSEEFTNARLNTSPNTTFEEVKQDSSSEAEEAKKEFERSLRDLDRAFDQDDSLKAQASQIKDEIEQAVRDAMQSEGKNVEKSVESILSKYKLNNDTTPGGIREKIIEHRDIIKEYVEKTDTKTYIENHESEIRTIIENRKQSNS